MATQSAAPPSQTDENTQNPASEVVQPIIEEQHDAKAVATEDNLTTSVFVNSEPIREEQVQNAVKFLSHPKVRGSPIIYRRSFLERKGLTKEEIDEAFRRVPDPTPAVSNVQPAAQNQDGRLKSSSNIQSQAPTQNPQPAAAAPGGVISKVSSLTQSRFNWSHAFYAVGILAVSGPGTAILLKNAIVPRLKSWICKVVLEEDVLTKKTNATPTLEEEATAAAKAAAAAAADVAQASQEMLMSKTEQKRYFEELMNLLDAQVQEMKLMSKTMRKLEGHSTTSGRVPHVEQEDHRVSITNSRQSNANGKVELDLHSVRSSPPPASVEPSVAPHPKSYMEPWDFGQSQNSLSHILPSQESSDGFNSQFADNGLINQVNGESKVPWWQQKNIRITEIENEDDHKTVSSDVFTNGRPVQNSWVPPQPPPVAMPEAAAAIRQAKKQSYQKEQLADEHLEAHSSDITDELQRMTKISESGVAEANGGSSKLNTSEIQAEGGAFESS
ncbi:peroxisomal membrane protein PEX14-like isoform X5 [Cornus florida]|uniref:peroxisomal membrane protein PEX14-like isoform X5 n=1 Tax=Cornus florida TaxID=4283 RepID=UPI00289A8BE1|nr:peroxisomal membrane protein PEX14-like isoform X5 [Cornus florida]